MKYILLVLVLLLGATGCATSSAISIQEATKVPVERVFRTDLLDLEGNVRVMFVRDRSNMINNAYNHLWIDGNKAASLDPGEKIEFILKPGDHIFGVIPTNPFGVYQINTIDQNLILGKHYYYRIKTDANYRTDLQRFSLEMLDK